MTALTAAGNRQFKVGTVSEVSLAASTTIYKGAGVCTNAAGFAVPASDTAALVTIGVAEETVDNSAGSAGDLTCKVRRGAVHLFDTDSDLGQASVNTSIAMWADDNALDVAANLTNDIVAGKVIEYVSSSQVWLEV